MTPGAFNLKINKGVTFLPLKFAAQDANGAPVDLTGWSAFAEVRKNPNRSTRILDLEPVITDAVNGETTIEFSDEQTSVMPAGNYFWDFVLEQPTGERLGPFLAGKCDIVALNTHEPGL